MFGKNKIFIIKNTHTSCVYFDTIFSGITPVYSIFTNIHFLMFLHAKHSTRRKLFLMVASFKVVFIYYTCEIDKFEH